MPNIRNIWYWLDAGHWIYKFQLKKLFDTPVYWAEPLKYKKSTLKKL